MTFKEEESDEVQDLITKKLYNRGNFLGTGHEDELMMLPPDIRGFLKPPKNIEGASTKLRGLVSIIETEDNLRAPIMEAICTCIAFIKKELTPMNNAKQLTIRREISDVLGIAITIAEHKLRKKVINAIASIL
ncbi:MAG: hypothetical protein Q8P93_02960 [bacterium]|nr:hypothetical protein [bacterium]